MNEIKKIKEVVRLQIRSGEANPTPPLAPVLGARGVNLINFCKQFNTESLKIQNLEKGTLVNVALTLYEDRSFFFTINSPPTTFLIKKYLNIEKGCSEPKKSKKQDLFLTLQNVKEIAKIKRNDLTSLNEESAIKIICGTIKSMGFSIKD